MFDILFGWPKASKCKKTLKRARCRLRILKNRRQTIATQLRKDLAELLDGGYKEIAIKRVEQLIQDESMVAAYELLDNFCEVILKRLCFIRRHKECPDDINEAVSSLIFASARCGDLPELYAIRKLFAKRYGHKFATAAVDLYSGNFVNKQVKENLSEKCVSDDLKYRIVDEIARDNYLQLQPKVLAIEYYPDWLQSQVKEYKGNQLVEETQESEVQVGKTNAGTKIHSSEDEGIERDIICVGSSMSNISENNLVPESCFNDTSALVSIVMQYPSPKSVKKLPEESHQMISPSASDFEDIEESHSSSSEEHSFCQDTFQFSYESGMHRDESMSNKSSIRSSRKSKRAPKKRPRRRSSLFENQCLMDEDFMVYYHKKCRTSSVHNVHSYPQKRLKQYSSPQKEKGSKRKKSLNFDMCDCSLDQPCYYCFYDDDEQNCSEDLAIKLKTEIIAAYDESKKGMDLVTIPQKPNRETNYHSSKSKSEMKLKTSLVRYAFPKILRTYSYSPPQRPKHIHPKLPDYEDLYAKFSAIKRGKIKIEEA